MDLHFLLNRLSDNFVVSFASSAKEALSLVNQFPQPDLMLLDVVMPEIDGYEMCAMLKNDVNTRNIPVIFVTGMQDTSDKTKGFNAGAVDYITKPLEIAELEARVQTHIRLKEQSQYLESMAYFDPLTQVPNRRKYNEVLQREWARCIRYHHQMSMIIIDIDFFKLYNDHYGHAEGDNCLIAVSRLLEDQVGRPTDLFARIGGEEFVMLLPDCNAAGAMKKQKKCKPSSIKLRSHTRVFKTSHISPSVWEWHQPFQVMVKVHYHYSKQQMMPCLPLNAIVATVFQSVKVTLPLACTERKLVKIISN